MTSDEARAKLLDCVTAVRCDGAFPQGAVVDALTAHEQALTAAKDAQLAECYRLSGADPDGDEDWRLAPRAVEEVRRLRAEFDAEQALTAAKLTKQEWQDVAEALGEYASVHTDMLQAFLNSGVPDGLSAVSRQQAEWFGALAVKCKAIADAMSLPAPPVVTPS